MWKILADFLLIVLFAMNKRALSQYLYTASASFVHSASIFPIPYDVKIAPTVDKLNLQFLIPFVLGSVIIFVLGLGIAKLISKKHRD